MSGEHADMHERRTDVYGQITWMLFRSALRHTALDVRRILGGMDEVAIEGAPKRLLAQCHGNFCTNAAHSLIALDAKRTYPAARAIKAN
jgi:hypothetical protein